MFGRLRYELSDFLVVWYYRGKEDVFISMQFFFKDVMYYNKIVGMFAIA